MDSRCLITHFLWVPSGNKNSGAKYRKKLVSHGVLLSNIYLRE